MHTHASTALPAPFRLVETRKVTTYFTDPRTGHEIAKPRLLSRLVGTFTTLDDLCAQRWSYYLRSWSALRFDSADLVDERGREGMLILDGFGDPVPMPVILGTLERMRAEARRKIADARLSFGRRWRHGHTLRRVRTMAERRANQEDWVDGCHIPVRGRRRHLPSTWDDIPIASLEDRNWKRFRKTRWRRTRLPC